MPWLFVKSFHVPCMKLHKNYQIVMSAAYKNNSYCIIQSFCLKDNYLTCSLTEKHFDKNPKVYCLRPSKIAFPYGVPKLNIFHNTDVYISVVPPGGFYSVERKPNDLRIEKNHSYGFKVRFVLLVKLYNILWVKHF